MEYNSVGWFEIPVTDLARARAFYESMLGIEMSQQKVLGYDMCFFPMDMDKKGAGGALTMEDVQKPGAQGIIIYFTCPDIEDALKRVVEAGGEVSTPLTDIQEFGEMALVKDSEGNVVGLHRAPRN